MGWFIAGLVLIISVLVGFAVNWFRTNKELRKDIKKQKKATAAAVKKQDKITKLHNNQQTIQEEADEQKNDLEKTEDSGLVDRANNLFP